VPDEKGTTDDPEAKAVLTRNAGSLVCITSTPCQVSASQKARTMLELTQLSDEAGGDHPTTRDI
jgi:hypothetical protein